jgi:hypothetical protein
MERTFLLVCFRRHVQIAHTSYYNARLVSINRIFQQVEGPPCPLNLFSPFQLGGLTLPNRIVVSPMCQYAATDGVPSDWHLAHLGQFAMSGPG